MSVLGESSVTVTAPGRPDRTAPLAGSLRGTIPAMIKPGTDPVIGGLTGALWAPRVAPDPLCAGERYAPEWPTAASPAASSLTLRQDGTATLSLAVAVDPLSIAGCATPAAPGSTTLTLNGRSGDGGLGHLVLDGSVGGIPIAAGVTGTAAVHLVVAVAFTSGV